MPTVNVHAAKSQLSRLLDAAVAGEAGKLHVRDDSDDPLPDDILAGFEGR